MPRARPLTRLSSASTPARPTRPTQRRSAASYSRNFLKSPLRMDRITAKSTARDVQAAASHDRTHWRRFLAITMQEGASLINQDNSINSWRNVPNQSQQALRKAVLDRLAAEDIPTVNVKVIDWRMAQVIKDTLKKTKTQSSSNPVNSETPVTPVEAGPSNAAGPADPSEPAGASGSYNKYYDPVRDP